MTSNDLETNQILPFPTVLVQVSATEHILINNHLKWIKTATSSNQTLPSYPIKFCVVIQSNVVNQLMHGKKDNLLANVKFTYYCQEWLYYRSRIRKLNKLISSSMKYIIQKIYKLNCSEHIWDYFSRERNWKFQFKYYFNKDKKIFFFYLKC